MKKRTININEIYDVTGKAYTTSGSVLVIESSKHTINLHLGDFTTDYIAQALWKIIKEKQRRIDSNKDALRGEEECKKISIQHIE